MISTAIANNLSPNTLVRRVVVMYHIRGYQDLGLLGIKSPWPLHSPEYFTHLPWQCEMGSFILSQLLEESP